jgi:cell division protein FtsI (penicillin-binding protein 3)
MTGVSKLRLVILFLFFLFLYLLVVANLFVIQIKQSSFYENMGKKQYNFTITLPPARAAIYDRNGIPLALNKDGFAAFITPNNLEEPENVSRFLQQNFPQAYQELKTKSSKQFMYVKRRLTQKEIEHITKANLPDLQLLQEPCRFYPVSSLGHTVGITDIDNNGLSGIELMYNKQLAGQPTTFCLEKDARSNYCYFKKETTIQGVDGTPIHLTLDSDLQFFAYDELQEHSKNLEAKEGMVIIMDPITGDILAMACYPDFDPNQPPPQDLWLTKNRIITEVHEPGSVMKVFPAIAALEEKIVTPDEVINCENSKLTSINGMRVSTWKACGDLTYSEIIRYSNNIGTSKISLRLGKPLYNHLQKCGFGKPTGINFLGEQSGFITPPNKWSKATPLSLSFGYEISTTPLHIACGFGMIANDGYAVHPQLFIDEKRISHIPGQRLYSEQTITQIRDIINLDHDGATARIGRINGLEVRGKTGTAYLISNKTYDSNRSIYTFAGIIEKDDYKRVIVTVIREPKKTSNQPVYAATVAVPLFKKIAHSMLIHDKVI